MITSENDGKYCMRNGMPNETVISVLEQDLHMYKKALNWLAHRCEELDRMANPIFENVYYKAKIWEELALKKAREEE